MVLVADGTAHTRSTAAPGVCRRPGLPWSLLGPLLAVPTPLRDPFYDLVARTRCRLFGWTDVRQVRPPAVRERFAERAPDQSP